MKPKTRAEGPGSRQACGRRQEEQAAESDTLQATCDLYLKREGPRMRTVAQRRSDLELLYSKLGRLPVAETRRSQFTHVLEHIHDNNGPQRAHRCQSALRTLLNWYAGRSDDYVSPLVRGGTNARSTPRERVLNDDELRASGTRLNRTTGPFGAFVRFTILTATRRGEGAGMTRDELSDDGKTWIIPAARYKTGKDTLIPPQRGSAEDRRGRCQCLAIMFLLRWLEAASGFPRSQRRRSTKISGIEKAYTLHDLRRTARTIVVEVSRCHARRTPSVVTEPRHWRRERRYDLHGYERTRSGAASRRWPRWSEAHRCSARRQRCADDRGGAAWKK